MPEQVLNWFGLTDKGNRREQNEDAFLAGSWLAWGQNNQSGSGVLDRASPRMWALADGMGGHENGAQASRNALSFLHREVEISFRLGGAHGGEREVEGFLLTAFHRIHEKITAMGAGRIRPMGTTLTAFFVVGDRAYAAHSGDSQLWRWDGRTLKLLTEDHNAAWGTAAPAGRSILTSCMGGGMDNPRIDVFPVGLGQHEVYLLNSDGLNEGLSPADLEKPFRSWNRLDDLGQDLVRRALETSSDNISLLLVQVP